MIQHAILNFAESTVSAVIAFIFLFSVFIALLRLIIYTFRRSTSSSSSYSRQVLEKSTKLPLAPKVTKFEIEESQLRRLAKEKENVK